MSAPAALHCVVPPYLLRALALHGEAPERLVALDTLDLDASLRTQRVLRGWGRGAAPLPSAAPEPAQESAPRRWRRVHSADGTQRLPGRLLRSEGDPVTGDAAADEAYDGLGATYDLLLEAFGRDSLDDAGMALVATVHYGRDYDNAAWNGEQMLFGDGDGRYFTRFTAAVDVIGHELAHGMTAYERGLLYQGQSGALNEHCSDVVGSLVKQHVHTPRQTAEEADWVIGAGLFTPAVNGVGIRSMLAPGTAYDDPVLGRDPQPDHMAGYVETAADNGGVHLNSGIPNRAFALTALAFGGYAWERAGSAWYAAMRDPRLSPTATFAEFAGITVDGATALAGPEAGEVVADAWHQVGVEPTAPAGPAP